MAEQPGNSGSERFIELLGTHEREIFHYVYSLTGDWNDAQELMQRVRIRIWQQFDQYDAGKPFGPWARAIAYYLVLAFRKECGRQKEMFGERVMELLNEAFGARYWPAIREDNDGRREALLDCLGKLKRDQRELVDRYYGSNEPVATMAERLGMNAVALRQALFRIRRSLQACVERTSAAQSRP
ncbi:MAG: sigma-70 family RNA polymerase sigma factor [Planctomycetales bacterium]|nr:sigma-70 family RNA polymerase sigma factor [Planctomycetales bacterium]